ncbi:MAG: hypothetical protein M1401_13570 [Chloroflexi bacterium]|nr:hypothetical protein [Bacteroidota bacterium]MCL5109865.1 hypothetical protein [Chloroflexota bacterium]
MPSDDIKLQVLNDHYKDTFVYIQAYIRQREWFFSAVLLVVVVMLFQIAAPNTSGPTISQGVSKILGFQGNLDVTFLTSVIWFLLLAFVFRYLQVTVNLERQYGYIHQVEEILSYFYNGETFTREGKFYLERYPLFSDWAHILYQRVFPALLLGVGVAKLVSEWPGFLWSGNLADVAWGFVFDALMYLLIVVSVLLYMEIIPIKRTVELRRALSVAFLIGLLQRIMPFSRGV